MSATLSPPRGDPELVRVCWSGVALIDAGWRPTRLTYCPDAGVATLAVQTPGGRVVEFRQPSPGPERDISAGGAPYCAAALRLTGDVARLARRCPQHVEYLSWFWTAAKGRVAPQVLDRVDQIPDPLLGAQPPSLRRCYWLLSTLVCQMGWRVFELGSALAEGGFVADIPGEVVAIFPAGMKRDGTEGTELAWLLRGAQDSALSYLSRQNRFTLARSRVAVGLQGSSC